MMSGTKLNFTFLGTGTSQGIPVIGCECAVCQSVDTKDKRLRSSLLIESDTTSVLIDVGPDVRQQLLLAKVKKLDAIVITHEHMDHVSGLDEIRPFNFQMEQAMRVYASERVQERLREQYSYIFAENKYPGAPSVELHTISDEAFQIGDIPFLPIEVMHGKLPIWAYRVHDFTYITDANYISAKEKEKMKGSRFLVVNALKREEHHSHFNVSQALELITEINAGENFLTHISHQLGIHEKVQAELPTNVRIAFDQLKILT